MEKGAGGGVAGEGGYVGGHFGKSGDVLVGKVRIGLEERVETCDWYI